MSTPRLEQILEQTPPACPQCSDYYKGAIPADFQVQCLNCGRYFDVRFVQDSADKCAAPPPRNGELDAHPAELKTNLKLSSVMDRAIEGLGLRK